MSTSWKAYANKISGVNTTGKVSIAKFRPGTKYIKLLVVADENSTPNTTTNLKNISFKRIN